MMKHSLYTSVRSILCLCFFLTLLSATAQSEKSRALTLDEYKKAKTFEIKDLESDTYVKFENAYVLDRFEMKPPYVFKYSDGIERRVYLYRLLDNKSKQSLGMVAIYYTPGNGKKFNVCIPSPESDKNVWALYIDDLKDYNKVESAFGSAFAYVMSREMSTLATGSSGASTTGNKTDYDVCFPANALVTLANGQTKQISEIKVGEAIASYNKEANKLETAIVQEIQIHEGKGYPVQTLFGANETVTASTQQHVSQITKIQATPNHPILTQNGRKAMNEIQSGDSIYVFDSATGEFITFKVYTPFTHSEETATKVYNLVTDKGNYLINGATVLDK
ncbi:Hint domain-containing protein [Xanthocytophaga agilis]|uniref:Hint domain-containing protein n=1 Tax=Xanthocytophaga agilis TaxID=3048010 RepID=A0AAE3UDR0_9BACT|nr:Hint domain-containing protein [Xanthocytophaga agilis]MDJ1500596.1 hypothetical protein [Xanthocytophaga agilis]